MPFAHALDTRSRRDELENLRRQQIVVQHHVRLTENPQRLQGEQLRVSWSRADEIHHSRCLTAVARRAKAVRCCHFMQLLLSHVGVHVRREQLAPRFAQLLNPLGVFGTELLLELDADTLRERRAMACGRNRDLQIAAVDDRRIVEVAVDRIIDRVDEDPSAMRLLVDRPGDVAGHGSDNEPDPLEIARIEPAPVPGDRAGAGEFLNGGCRLRRNNRNGGARRHESAHLGLRHGTCAHKKDRLSLQLHENRK